MARLQPISGPDRPRAYQTNVNICLAKKGTAARAKCKSLEWEVLSCVIRPQQCTGDVIIRFPINSMGPDDNI